MAYGKDITITRDGQEAIIKERSWGVYERNGWTRADDGSSGSSAPAESEPESEAPATKTTTRKKAD